MVKEVKIKITGAQTAPDFEGEPEIIELETRGSFYMKDGVNYLKYDEYFEGVSEPAKNLLKFDEQGLEMTKKGSVNTVMEFGKNKHYSAHYVTPHGPIVLEILTDTYEMRKTDSHIQVDVNYCIDFNYDYMTNCSLTINIEE